MNHPFLAKARCCIRGKTFSMNPSAPPWKALLSNKGLLASAFRENDSLITKDSSRFLPHVILD